MRQAIILSLIIVALAGGLLLACAVEEPTETESPAIVNNSPANCLKAIAAAWSAKNYGRFKPCLAANFTFDFNPADVGEKVAGYDIPRSWTYDDVLNTTQNMFLLAGSLDCEIPVGAVGTPGDNATTWRATDIPFRLTIMEDTESGYRVGAGYCYFTFERYMDGGERRWRLTEWWDFTRAAAGTTATPGVTPTSLGLALARYR
jgi:hypothetical protein